MGKAMPLDRSGIGYRNGEGGGSRGVRRPAADLAAVKANENKSWFGLGGEVTIHVWGRPVLDRTQQVLRIENISLDVGVRSRRSACSAWRRARRCRTWRSR